MSTSRSPPPPNQDCLKYTHQFRWDSSVPDSVAVKGSFDDWSLPLVLTKERSGKFGAKIVLQPGAKITYKVSNFSILLLLSTPSQSCLAIQYVVDGHWRHNPNEPTELDPDGNINNVLDVPALPLTLNQPTAPVQAPPSDLSALNQPASPPASPSPASSHHLLMSTPFPIVFPSPPVPDPSAEPHSNPAARRTLSLAPRPPPLRPHRTTSQHAHSLLLAAPRTPSDKASPAGASVSNVVSAMAGVAATAIPAAILAVTGKDILRPPSPTDEPTTNALPSVAPPRPPGTLLVQSDSTYGPPPVPAPASDRPRAPLMPVNDPADKVESPPEPLSTHIPLPPSDGQASSNLNKDKVEEGVLGMVSDDAQAVGVNAVTTLAVVEENQAGLSGEEIARQAGKGGASGEDGSGKGEKASDEVGAGEIEMGKASSEVVSGEAGKGVATSEVARGEGDKGKTSNTSVEKITSPEQAETSDKQSNGVADTSITNAVATGEPARESTPLPLIQPDPAVPQASVETENVSAKPRPAEQFVRKTSGWRYSVGSIRSRRVSGEQNERRSGEEGSIWSGSGASRRNGGASGETEEVDGTPRRRKPSIFQKIKGVLSPHRHSSLGNHSQQGSSSSSHLKKDKTFKRTSTIGR